MAYGLTRPLVMGTDGMVVSGHPLASLAGAQVLIAGGNAVDAAVAAAAALAVVEPSMSGLGGVGYLLLYRGRSQDVLALDFVGRSPRGLNAGQYSPATLRDGALSILVPGCVGGWFAALERYGTLPRDRVFHAALEFAEHGFPLSLQEAEVITSNTSRLEAFEQSALIFLGNGGPPRPGTILRQRQLAETLRAVMEGGAGAFYAGPIGAEISRSVREAGGVLSEEDLAGFEAVWSAPVSAPYGRYIAWSPPPPSAGFEYLEVLRLADELVLTKHARNSARYIHLLAEAIKLTARDRIRYASAASPPLHDLLSREHTRSLASCVDRKQAKHGPGDFFVSDFVATMETSGRERRYPEHTTHLSVVDREGSAVSLTQSLGWFFGSGMVAGDTGIVLNDFAYWFDQDVKSPNAVGPDKRVAMCLAPSIVTDAHQRGLVLALGTPGGWGIVQNVPQMILNHLGYGMNVQAAIEAPRFQVLEGMKLLVEDAIPAETRRALARLGHDVRRLSDVNTGWLTSGTPWRLGGGIGISRSSDGILCGGADPRRDGYAIGY